MAIALKGAIIIAEKGTTMVYKRKCEKCGWIDTSTVQATAPSSRNAKTSSSFSCPKCRNRQSVEIQGS